MSGAQAFLKWFLPNPAKHGHQTGFTQSGEKIVSTREGEPVTDKLVQKHLCGEGHFTALGYLPGDETGTRSGMIDLDLSKYPEPGDLHDAWLRLVDVAEAWGWKLYREKSTRGGLHGYVFAEKVLAHKTMRKALRALGLAASLSHFETYPAGDGHLSTWHIMPYAGAANDPKRLGNTFLTTVEGQPIPYDELAEWLEPTPAVPLAEAAANLDETDKPLEASEPADLAPEALDLLKTAASKPPAIFERHGSLVAFLNLAERCGGQAEMFEHLKTEAVRLAWVKDNSRDARAWGNEVDRWAKAKPSKNRRGIPFLVSQGFNIPDLPRYEATWGERQELPDLAPDPPDLSAEMLPEPLRLWILDAAQRACVHVAFIAMVAVCSLGAVLGRTLTVRPKSKDDWDEVANLWCAIVAPPSSLKSLAIAEGTAHIRRLAAKAVDEFQAGQQANAAKAEIFKLELDLLKKAARAKNAKPADFQAPIQAKLIEMEVLESDTERRYILNDATVEKAGELLLDNPRGLLYLRDEVVGLLQQCDRPGYEHYRAFLLEAWNAKGAYTFDRIGRGTLHIPALALSVCGSIQPGRLRSYIAGALAESSEADGLLQRFQLTAWFDKPRKWEYIDRHPDKPARDRAFRLFEFLDRKVEGLAQVFSDADDSSELPYLRFDDEAQELFRSWLDTLMTRLRSDELSHTPAFQAHLAKYPSLVPSLALLFHLVTLADKNADALTLITFDATVLAVSWVEYLELHARKLYAAELNTPLMSAHALAEKVKTGEVTDGQKVSDIYKHKWPGLTQAAEVEAALAILKEANWLRVEEVKNEGARASQLIRVHPQLRSAA